MHGNSYNQGSPLLLGGTDFFNFFFFVILDAESERCRCAREGLSRVVTSLGGAKRVVLRDQLVTAGFCGYVRRDGLEGRRQSGSHRFDAV